MEIFIYAKRDSLERVPCKCTYKKQPRIARQQEVVDAQNYKAFTLAARLDFLRAAVFL